MIPFPTAPQEIVALRQQPIDEELIATAIAGVVQITRSQGRSLEELKAEVLADEGLLDFESRRRLSEIVSDAWRVLA
ncbi:MAG: hypothetical protein HC895_07040 [Leptolyngbyaceae cyanobacterium SM1_3_5]|nr:hypothetical protein [Leptolyngbyaceae cyanobacterium SM1_3_5]